MGGMLEEVIPSITPSLKVTAMLLRSSLDVDRLLVVGSGGLHRGSQAVDISQRSVASEGRGVTHLTSPFFRRSIST